MFTLVISLVVVGGAVTAVTALVVREMPKPATNAAARDREGPSPEPAVARERFTLGADSPAPTRVVRALPPTSLAHRIRSAIVLVGLVTVLGIGAAVTIAAVALGVLFAARQALG